MLRLFNILIRVYIVVFIVTGGLGMVRMSRRQRAAAFGVFALILAYLALTIHHPEGWGDISRRMETLDLIRQKGYTVLDLMDERIAEEVGAPTYRYLFVFNAMCCFVAWITTNDYVLPALCVALDMIMVGYVVLDWTEEHPQHWLVKAMSLFMCLAMLPYIHMLSGMRNALAVCVCGLGIYRYLYKGKHPMEYIAAVIVAVMIHPAVLFSVPFVILARIDLSWYGAAASLLFPFVIKWGAELVLKFNFTPLLTIAYKYIIYSSPVQYRASRFVLYGVILLLLAVLAAYLYRYRQGEYFARGSRNRRIGNFIGYYTAYILSNIGNYDLVLRPAYLLGFLAPVLSSLLTEGFMPAEGRISIREPRGKNTLPLLVALGCFALSAYINLRFIQMYGSYLS